MKNDCIVLNTLLSSMQNDIMVELSHYQTTNATWEALEANFGAIYATRLHGLSLHFDTYQKYANHTMNQHLKVISNIIRVESYRE